MKKLFGIIIFIFGLISLIASLPHESNKDYDYLRLHIRANSNLSVDQTVKYEIKNELVAFLSPYFSETESKLDAISLVTSLTPKMEEICDNVLKNRGFNYTSNVKINNEYFPTRTYSNTTLESGYYDAVIVELGEAEGDNWWCVMYPPLCFVNNFETTTQINYKSKIVEWFNSLFN